MQERITVPRTHVYRKPDGISLEEGATIPHRYAAIFVALFFEQGLRLPLEPSVGSAANSPVIVWGAASGTGMFAIQALKAHGYQSVIAVASLRQKDKLLAIGASDVFDRNDPQIAANIKAKYPGVSLGMVCQIDVNGWKALFEVVKQDGTKKTAPKGVVAYITQPVLEVPEGVELRRSVVFNMLKDPMGDQVISKYLPKLLESPTFQLPKAPKVFSEGSLLERAKEALDVAGTFGQTSVVIKVN